MLLLHSFSYPSRSLLFTPYGSNTYIMPSSTQQITTHNTNNKYTTTTHTLKVYYINPPRLYVGNITIFNAITFSGSLKCFVASWLHFVVSYVDIVIVVSFIFLFYFIVYACIYYYDFYCYCASLCIFYTLPVNTVFSFQTFLLHTFKS